MMLAAMNWTPVAISLIVGATLVLSVMFRGPKHPPIGVSTTRLEEIDDDLAAIRADLAEIKQSLAELDRLFKSVG